jgi:hypothetical protein
MAEDAAADTVVVDGAAVLVICHDFGGWPRKGEHATRPATLALTALGLALAVAARRKLHHGGDEPRSARRSGVQL